MKNKIRIITIIIITLIIIVLFNNKIEAKNYSIKENESIISTNQLDEQQVEKYTQKIKFFSLVFIIYWIIILAIYEIDEKIPVSNINEDELFEKYNPMFAGCFEGSRDVLPRDIVAVILNLIEKKCLELEIRNNLNEKDYYKYYIKKVPQLENKMDSIEKYVYDWIFESVQYDGECETIDLIETLKILPKQKQSAKKFKLLNIIVQKELNRKGVNKNKSPFGLRFLNTLILFFSILVILIHMNMQNLLPEFNIEPKNELFGKVLNLAVILIPLYGFVMILIISLYFKLRDKISKKISRITEKKMIITVLTIIFIFVLSLVIIMICGVKLNEHIMSDLILLLITTIIALTDNVMQKNDINRVEDYSRLCLLKNKIKNYTLLKEKDIEQVVLWDKYLIYAISFGITEKIHNKLKDVILNDELLQIINSEEINLYIISGYNKFYRENIWYENKK